jgi:DNA modification methylase
MAAESTSRVCRGVELDPLYVDVIVRRYQTASADTAALAETGESFHELAARREREASTSGPPEGESSAQNDMGKH